MFGLTNICTASQLSLFPTSPRIAGRLGVGKEFERITARTHPGTYNIMLPKKKKRRGNSGGVAIPWGLTEHSLLVGDNE